MFPFCVDVVLILTGQRIENQSKRKVKRVTIQLKKIYQVQDTGLIVIAKYNGKTIEHSMDIKGPPLPIRAGQTYVFQNLPLPGRPN